VELLGGRGAGIYCEVLPWRPLLLESELSSSSSSEGVAIRVLQ